jgi:hypothetical protein
MPATAKPFIGLPRVTLERKPAPILTSSSEEFQLSEGSTGFNRRQLQPSLIPDKPEFTSIHNPDAAELLQNSEDYKSKLSDPDFIQNITKAHVFHATNLNDEDNLRLDDPAISGAPIQYNPDVFRIQDLNPFGEKPEGSYPAVPDLPTYPVEPPPRTKVVLPRLEEIAPASKPFHASGHIDRPEVVYEPTDVYGKKVEVRRVDDYSGFNSFGEEQAEVEEEEVTVATEPPFMEEETTEGSTFAEVETTTIFVDPIAEHVNKLLRHYLTTQVRLSINLGM